MLRLAASLVVASVRGAARRKIDFWSGIAAGIAWQAGLVVFAGVLVTNFESFGGWQPGEVLLLISMRLCSHAIATTMLGGLLWMGSLVRAGLIDQFRARPAPVFLQVCTARFNSTVIGDILVGSSMR